MERGRRPTLPHRTAVPSALAGLASLFGMGRGGTPPPRPPGWGDTSGTGKGRRTREGPRRGPEGRTRAERFGQLVALGFGVAAFTPAPYRRPRLGRPSKRSSHLAAGFALRCIQRLSRPDADTRRCAWRHNRQTGGPSATVLSY